MRIFQSLLNSVATYFDLFSDYRITAGVAQAGKKEKRTIGWELALFGSLALGIITKGWFDYLAGRADMPFGSVPRMVAALVAAIITFPGAYKAAMKESGPGLVQCCIVFTTGLGVRTAFDLPGENP